MEYSVQMAEFAEKEVEEHLGGYHHALHNGGEEDQGKGNANHGIQETEALPSFWQGCHSTISCNLKWLH